MTWLSAGNTKTMGPNKNLSFCPGAIIDGETQPFVVDSGARHAHFLQTLLLSIANTRVYHSALHSGSNSLKEFGLHTFPKSVLQQFDAAPRLQLTSPFTPPLRPPAGDAHISAPASSAIPKNLTIRFGAHRASVYGNSDAAKITPFAASAKDLVRESQARDFIQESIQPKIRKEEFPDYQKFLDDVAAYPTPVILTCLPSLAATPAASGQNRSRVILTEGEGKIKDICTSGSGDL
jgi:hypothetical protein